jgi:hypothetical protein
MSRSSVRVGSSAPFFWGFSSPAWHRSCGVHDGRKVVRVPSDAVDSQLRRVRRLPGRVIAPLSIARDSPRRVLGRSVTHRTEPVSRSPAHSSKRVSGRSPRARIASIAAFAFGVPIRLPCEASGLSPMQMKRSVRNRSGTTYISPAPYAGRQNQLRFRHHRYLRF